MTASRAEIAAAYQAGLDSAYDHSSFQGQLLDGLGGLSRDSPEAALAGAAEALNELADRLDDRVDLGAPDLDDRHQDAAPDLRAAYQAAFRQQWGRARLLLAHGDVDDPDEAAVALRSVARACVLAGWRLAGGEDAG